MLKWPREALTSIATYLKATDSYDVRRYLAIFFMAGGSMVMTLLVAIIIFFLQTYAVYLFWIAIALIILIGLQQTGFIGLIVKRSISISKENISINDGEEIKAQAQAIKEQAQEIKDVVG